GKNGKKAPGIVPGGPGFLMNLLTAIVIFFLLISTYSFIMDLTKPKQEVSLSQVAADVKSGAIKEIDVNGNDLDLVYADASHKTAMKDPSTGLPETLATYGTTPAQL